ncbi:hypothetical protein NKG05_24185 [Oerskovia sp. M15]
MVHAVPAPNEKVVALAQAATFGAGRQRGRDRGRARRPRPPGHGGRCGLLADVVRAEVLAAGVDLVDVTEVAGGGQDEGRAG